MKTNGDDEEYKFERTIPSREILLQAKTCIKEKKSTLKALWLLRGIEQNEPEATFLMGVIYFDGLGIDEDVKLGIEYMKKMSCFENLLPDEEALRSQALYNLGLVYFRGISVHKDDDQTESYWLQSAQMKVNAKTKAPHPASVKSQTALGKFYSHTDHHHLEKSHHWHSMACSNGSVESEAALGVMHLYGLGAEEDPIRAYGHLLNASISGNVYAQGYLTALYYSKRMYHRAVCMGKMLSEYEDLEIMAASTESDVELVEQGVALGCFYVALCLQYGYATRKDISQAKELVKRAIHLHPTLVHDLHTNAILGTNK